AEVMSGDEILEVLAGEFKLEPRPPAYRGEVATHWRQPSGRSEIGLIQSVTRPFCSDCQRLRLSADGKLFTCLFAADGHDFRGLLRSTVPDDVISRAIRDVWVSRSDRYSEERGTVAKPRAE